MGEVKPNLQDILESLESMPMFGELRRVNEQLKFGQYITILKEWFERHKRTVRDFVDKLENYPTEELKQIKKRDLLKAIVGEVK